MEVFSVFQFFFHIGILGIRDVRAILTSTWASHWHSEAGVAGYGYDTRLNNSIAPVGLQMMMMR